MPRPPTTSASVPATIPAPPGPSHALTGCGTKASSTPLLFLVWRHRNDHSISNSFPALSQPILNVLAVVGSLNRTSSTRSVINHGSAHGAEGFSPLKSRVERAAVYNLGTHDYHGSISSALKNFLDHFWEEFAGKLFVTIVASPEKGLTVTDQLRTVARQCYAWSLPYGVAFADQIDVQEGRVVSDSLEERLKMLVHDVRVYGQLLAGQRRADLAGTAPGFLAKHRK